MATDQSRILLFYKNTLSVIDLDISDLLLHTVLNSLSLNKGVWFDSFLTVFHVTAKRVSLERRSRPM